MIEIDISDMIPIHPPIGEMTEDELLECFEDALKNKENATEDFIVFYIQITDKKFPKIKNKHPEYFL